jgi:hypothetical protein
LVDRCRWYFNEKLQVNNDANKTAKRHASAKPYTLRILYDLR